MSLSSLETCGICMQKIVKTHAAQYLAGFLAGILVLIQAAGPLVLAEETVVSPLADEQAQQSEAPENSPTPPEEPSETPTNTPTPTPSEETTSSETAEESTTEEPPAGESTESSPPSDIDSSLTATNSAEVTAEATTSANTGNNEITSPSGSQQSEGGSQSNTQNSSGNTAPGSTPTPTPEAEITTGDALSLTQQENSVNTTSINSETVYHTINIYVDGEGDIDLSMPSDLAQALVAMHPEDEFITALTSVSQEATVSSTIEASSNTGDNSAGGSQNLRISTGDAITLLSLLNRINFVMIDSVVHVVTINIFGNFLGNILLPDLPAGAPCDTCGTTTVAQEANVTTTADASADTGNNTVVAYHGDITTGNAYAGVQIVSIINTLMYGSRIAQLYIFNFGQWDGSFLGWSQADGQILGDLIAPTADCVGCDATMLLSNTADVETTIRTSANTGGNTIEADGGTIETGRAFSAASVVNLINSAFVRSYGFFGFINIFGSWTGDIGSKSLFPTPTPTPEEHTQAAATQGESSGKKQTGGMLEVSAANNVGQYVFPGDTVTFFIQVKNPGSGPVYDAVLDLRLVRGTDRGGVRIPVGTIEPGKKKKITTGIVLSAQTTGGEYTGLGIVTGTVGPDDSKITGSAQTAFTVWGFSGQQDTGEPIIESVPEQKTEVLGATTAPQPINPNVLLALLVQLALVPQYALFKLLKDKEIGSIIFMPSAPALARLRALHLFLL